MPRRIRGRRVCWNDLRQTRIVIDGRLKMKNSCCSNNGNRGKKETAKKNSGCTCLCLEFSTREAVNALVDRFKEVANPIIRSEKKL